MMEKQLTEMPNAKWDTIKYFYLIDQCLVGLDSVFVYIKSETGPGHYRSKT